MKILILGEAQSTEQDYVLQRLIDRIDRELKAKLDRRSSTSRDGTGAMEAYGVVSTPAIIVARDDGAVVAMWQYSIPEFSDLSYFYHMPG